MLDKASGEPVAGALVALGTQHPMAESQPWMAQNVFPPLRAVTDDEGRFSVAFTKDGKGDLRVQHHAYVESKQVQKLPPDGEIEIKLAPALRIAGVVRYCKALVDAFRPWCSWATAWAASAGSACASAC